MKKSRLLFYIGTIIFFLLLVVLYFKPAILGNYQLAQHDITQWRGTAQELYNYKQETGEYVAWTNGLFSGMPSYLVSHVFEGNLTREFTYFMWLGIMSPARIIFIGLLSMLIFLTVCKVNKYVSILGSIAFAFSAFNLISLMAGHNSKIEAAAYIPLVFAGIQLIISRKKYLLGSAVLAFGILAEVNTGHFQIVYYLVLIATSYGLLLSFELIKNREYTTLLKMVGALMLAIVIGGAPNYSKLVNVQKYGKYSIRGKSELTTKKESLEGSGLDKDYAFAWSQGRLENLTFLIPNIYGGASSSPLDQNSETYKAFVNQGASKNQALEQIQRMPTYWGSQSFTAGPVYLGAVVCFLFMLGLLTIKKSLRYWLVAASLLSIFLSMGKNFSSFNYFMFDYLPGLNKFRTPSMAVIISHFTFSFGAAFGLHKVLFDFGKIHEFKKKLLIAFGLTGGVSLFFFLFGGGIFDFQGVNDAYISKNVPWLLDALIADRKSMMQSDAFRSFILILMAAVSIWISYKGKLKSYYVAIGLTVLVLFDLWNVDRRYLGEDNFEKKTSRNYFQKTIADNSILEDTSLSYRVFNINNPFNEARTSYYHKSIGGYHGAKLRRYQDVINAHLSKNNERVLSMLNTKYVITDLNKPAQRFPNLGNAWFVDELVKVNTPDEELAFLGSESFLPSKIAVIDQNLFPNVNHITGTRGTIDLVEYRPNYLKYNSQAGSDGFAVFSEVYYPEGWEAKIDGKLVEHVRVNYILRGMNIPAGKHTIEFEFSPKSYVVGEKVSLISSYIFFVFVFGVFAWVGVKEFRKEE